VLRSASLERLAAIASVVFIADFASKRWALTHLETLSSSGPGLHLAVVNNTRLAWGLETGGFELEVTALATIAIVLVIARIARQLTAVDSSAPTMLALLLGAGAANLADALIPPHGVVDFIAVTTVSGVSTAFNVADVAAAIGLGLCARTAWRIGQTIIGRRVVPQQPIARSIALSTGVRRRLLVSGAHALVAMCVFVWIYSMAIAWTPDAGAAAPSALLLGAGIFAATFAASQTFAVLALRHAVTAARVQPVIERVVLDGSLATPADDRADGRTTPRARRVRRDVRLPYEARPLPDVREDLDGV
jgi:lipoprotein signal peptidase